MSALVSDERVIQAGLAKVGVHEDPPNSNHQEFGIWYGMDRVAWCAIYVSWVLSHGGRQLAISSPKGYSYCPNGEAFAKAHGIWRDRSYRPKRGDLVFFSFGGTRSDHTGIVLGVLPDGRIHTLEGNTSGGNDANGGIVMERYRSTTSVRGYMVCDWQGTPAPAPIVVKPGVAAPAGVPLLAWGSTGARVSQLQFALNYGTGARLEGDGKFFDATREAVRNLQRIFGLDPDGVYGPASQWVLQVACNAK